MRVTKEEQFVWENSEAPNGVYPTVDEYTVTLAELSRRELYAPKGVFIQK